MKIPVGSLIFSDVILRGFWMTRWNSQHFNDEKRHRMLDNLFSLIRLGKLKPPLHDLVPFDQYELAIKNAMPQGGMIGRKQILMFDT